MRIRVLLIILSAFISILVYAQPVPAVNVQVKGQVVDSLTNDAISYATIRVTAKSEPTLLKVFATDDNGKFQFSMDKAGEYILSIEYLGKNTVNKDIVIDDEKVLDLGKILMTDNSKLLSEVVVSAQKPLVQVDLDKIVYSMESDPESKTNNVLEMLKKVPMVTVDGDENVQLKGSSNFKIYLNGKPSNMITKNPKDILRSMPASTVKDIQVITDPGAKYDAEGVTGIINIITQTNSSMGGYTATLSGRVDDRGGFGGGVYLSTKYGKVGFTGNYNYYDWKQPEAKSSLYQENLSDDVNNKYFYQNGTSKNNGNGQYGSGELSYEIDTLNLINVGFNRYYGGYKTRTDFFAKMLMNDNNTSFYEYEQTGKFTNMWGGTDLNVDYQRTFKKKDQLLTVSYRLSLNPDNTESRSDVTDASGTLPATVVTNTQFSDAGTTEHTFQTDFVTPFGKVHNLEAGVKYIIRLNESSSGYEELTTDSIWESVLKPTDRFEHRQDILSAYGGYNLKFKKWGVKTGLRYESTRLDVQFPKNEALNFKADYNNWVPSATVTYQLKPAQNIRFGYNMRIWRPGIWQLNPNEDTSNPNFVRVGNPNLGVVESHSINANYGLFNSKLNFNLNMSYDFQNNGIENVLKEKNGVLYNTYENIAKRKNIGMNGYISWTPNKKIRLNANTSIRYSDIKSNNNSDLSNQGFTYSMWGGGQYSLPKSLKLYLNVGGSSPYIGLQTKGSGYFFHSVSASKGFLKDKLDIRVYVQNPFRKNMEWKNETRSEMFYTKSSNINLTRSFGVSVSYRFGEMKQQIKKATRTIQNDDSMGGGQNQGGQGQSGGGQN
ncbi:MAG: TonB-dependent receptor [Candidatus Azobacteroides sp.]|nr:TonB-dependent receptor [Candidatus Azobacteroides sp.]